MDAARLLELAADRIERVGWTQGMAARDADGRYVDDWSPVAAAYSAAGAISASSADQPLEQRRRLRIEAAHALYRSIPELAPHDRAAVVSAVHDWQDSPGRSRAEVTAALRRAAAQLRGRRNADQPAP